MRSVSRRTLLRGSALGVAALTVAGCASEEPKPVVAAPPDPETVLLNQLIAGKERTVALYASAASAKLAPFAERHEAHLAELRRRLRDKLLSSASSAAVPFSPPSPASTPLSPSGTPAPSRRPTLRSLRDLEQKAAALRPRQLAGVSPALAQLIASIGACEAAHAMALSRSL
ncbi:twin-arginine translocation signal domain-containing protein [Streptosporangium subroseum]|uniref:twin-arginine translocation signal domain-containing protein n=1 Tax=Streptosporangium subroseum TaxID=106412 RepID=UPI00308E3BA7|nr:twin-arginine translocation signal domain-containing protein [Streptosporangium subroseum]